MKKYVLDKASYTFDSTNSLIIFNTDVELRDILLITNVTDGITIYNFACEGQTGDIVSNVLSLTYDTSSMEDSDELLIILQEEDTTEVNLDKINLNSSRAEITLNDILEEQRLTNKLLKKIYNPE